MKDSLSDACTWYNSCVRGLPLVRSYEIKVGSSARKEPKTSQRIPIVVKARKENEEYEFGCSFEYVVSVAPHVH